jgi:hypothetical protein
MIYLAGQYPKVRFYQLDENRPVFHLKVEYALKLFNAGKNPSVKISVVDLHPDSQSGSDPDPGGLEISNLQFLIKKKLLNSFQYVFF